MLIEGLLLLKKYKFFDLSVFLLILGVHIATRQVSLNSVLSELTNFNLMLVL